MIKKILSCLLLCLAMTGVAQEYEIGFMDVALYDDVRNRTINTTFFFPALEFGENSEVANGEFGVISFGHGFVMNIEAYQNIVDHLVPRGMAIIMVDTENSLSPNHQDFGLDMAFALNTITRWTYDDTSMFHYRLKEYGILMGHSMGGGAAILAAEHVDKLDMIILMAPAETQPSAIEKASTLNHRLLLVTGEGDLVTPTESHGLPIYEAIQNTCKVHIDIIGGGHCLFANENFNCDLGESIAGSNIDISREDQHQILFDYFPNWINFSQLDDINAYIDFVNAATIDERITLNNECLILSQNDLVSQEFQIIPNPVIDNFGTSLEYDRLTIYNQFGQVVHQSSRYNEIIEVSHLVNGSYILQIDHNQKIYYANFIKL